jgi:hypothetical protein
MHNLPNQRIASISAEGINAWVQLTEHLSNTALSMCPEQQFSRIPRTYGWKLTDTQQTGSGLTHVVLAG